MEFLSAEDIGGERLASILTILNSAIAHGLNPREYLVVVTEGMLNGQDPAELLPDRITHGSSSFMSDEFC